jgi:hypothetical protein
MPHFNCNLACYMLEGRFFPTSIRLGEDRREWRCCCSSTVSTSTFNICAVHFLTLCVALLTDHQRVNPHTIKPEGVHARQSLLSRNKNTIVPRTATLQSGILMLPLISLRPPPPTYSSSAAFLYVIFFSRPTSLPSCNIFFHFL